MYTILASCSPSSRKKLSFPKLVIVRVWSVRNRYGLLFKTKRIYWTGMDLPRIMPHGIGLEYQNKAGTWTGMRTTRTICNYGLVTDYYISSIHCSHYNHDDAVSW